MKNNATAINNNENKRPTSLLIPKTSPLARTKLRLAIWAIIIPDTIAPMTPQMPTHPPMRYAISAMITVEAK